MSPKVRAAPLLKPGLTATADYAAKLAPFDQKTLALWAADCAGHVVRQFQSRYPKDDRPKRAITAARAWTRGEMTMMMARAAAVQTHAAAREASHPAAVAAARAAGHAAATAHSIRHARGAAAYAIVSVIAAASPERQESAAKAERQWQLARLPKRASAKPTTIDAYLATLSGEKRAALEKLRRTIKAAAPRAEECISYQIPAFRLGGKFLVAFSAAAKHCAFYPGAYPLKAHREELKNYDMSKGTIRFPADNPLPAALVRKLVKARISQRSEERSGP